MPRGSVSPAGGGVGVVHVACWRVAAAGRCEPLVAKKKRVPFLGELLTEVPLWNGLGRLQRGPRALWARFVLYGDFWAEPVTELAITVEV